MSSQSVVYIWVTYKEICIIYISIEWHGDGDTKLYPQNNNQTGDHGEVNELCIVIINIKMDYTTGTTSSMNNMRPIFGAYAFQGEHQIIIVHRHERIQKDEKKGPIWLITMFPGTNKTSNNTSESKIRNQYRLLPKQ